MKILFIIPSYEPAWAAGGTVTATVNLCRELVKKGLEVVVYTTDSDGNGGYLNVDTEVKIDKGGVGVWYYHCNLLPSKSFHSSTMIKAIEKNIKDFDIVNMSAIWQFIGYKAYKACKKNDIPYVVTPHSSLMKHAFYDIGNTFIKSLYWRIFGKVVVDNAASIHYLSKGERLESDEFTKGEYFIVPNGIVVDQYKVDILDRNKARLENGIKESEFLILHLGRIHSKKNIEYTIASLPELIQMNDKVRFIIVGNIENREYYLSLKKLAKDYNVEKYIIWKDQIPNNEVKYYYSSANLMVLPSKIEGVSMALTESMVQGLPLLISNRVANYREIESDECGIVVDPTLEATKKALINIVSKKIDLNKMSSNSYNSVVSRYKIEQVASRMLSEYKKILQKKSLINDGK